MGRFKPVNYDQLQMLPVNLKSQLVPGSLEHTIHLIVEEEIDLAIFSEQYHNDDTGRLAYNPKVLLKTILLAYSRGILGSRKIERACRENVIFMALTCGQVPDHTTITRFISTMQQEIIVVFQRVLLVCDGLGLLGGTHFAIDGVKLRSNASRQLSGTFSELEKRRRKLEKRLSKLLHKHIAIDQGIGLDDTTKRKALKLRQNIDKINRFLDTQEPKRGKKRQELKSNVTDNDSQVMMTSHGVIQGYNAQAVVDAKNQIIIHADAGDSGQDDEHLGGMIKGVKENLQAIGRDAAFEKVTVLGDPNYHSPTNLLTCVEEDVRALFPDTHFRQTGPNRPDGPEVLSRKDFIYDESGDCYTCPAGKQLSRQSDIKRHGKKYRRCYAANESACAVCAFRTQCLPKANSKRRELRLYYDKRVEAYARDMEQWMNTKEGRELYNKRIGIIEPVFGNLREQKRLDRFTLRSKSKVNVQWLLYCIVHNLEKVAGHMNNTQIPAFT